MASKKYNLNYIVDMIKNHQKKEENMGNRCFNYTEKL